MANQNAPTSQPRKPERGPVAPRWARRAISWLNVFVYTISKGRMMNKFAGDPICLVTMTGAKSGRRRTIPLMYVPYRDGVLLVASLGGARSHPLWYHNLVAHPDVTVLESGRRRHLRARLLAGEERAAAWPVCVEHYAPYAEYQEKTNREIPVFCCEPVAQQT